MHWPYPRVIAHRGGGSCAPENTLAALRAGHGRGFHAVEFDVMLSGDAHPVLIHDDTLDRTTSGHGPVAAMPLATLATLDAGSWYGAGFRGEPLPTFTAAARLCRELGLLANVEIKPSPGLARQTGHIVASQARALWEGADVPPLLSSFEEAALQAAQAAAPALPRALIFDAIPADWQARAQGLGCIAIHCNAARLEPSLAGAILGAGYALAAWTVNDLATARRLFSWGVTAVFTDRLDLIGPDFAG